MVRASTAACLLTWSRRRCGVSGTWTCAGRSRTARGGGAGRAGVGREGIEDAGTEWLYKGSAVGSAEAAPEVPEHRPTLGATARQVEVMEEAKDGPEDLYDLALIDVDNKKLLAMTKGTAVVMSLLELRSGAGSARQRS